MCRYRIGPAEVEAVLMQHAAVADAACVGSPDPLRGEVLSARCNYTTTIIAHYVCVYSVAWLHPLHVNASH